MRTMIKKFLPRLISPARVFIALIVIVILWLLPVYIRSEKQKSTGIFAENAEASNHYACDSRVCGQCCDHGSCQPCGGDDDDPPPPSPPTVSASFICNQWGAGGWCRNNARLDVTASDPQGYSLSISGTNPTFGCAGSCTVNLPAGNGVASYTATAATSGLTATSWTGWAYDPQPPTISASVSGGTINGNGWYASPITLSATATDATSGLSGAVQFSVDNGSTWQNQPPNLSEGIHLVTLQVFDIAGNVSTRQDTLKIDTTSPAVSIAATGTTGSGIWYVSSVTLDAFTSDNLSGVASIQYRINGGPWTDGSSVTLPDGVHTVDFQVFDAAGNFASASQTVNVDTTPPSSLITSSGTAGGGSWYVSPATLTITSSDNLSDVAGTQYRIDGGQWADGSSVTLSDGIFTVDFLVRDAAGNSTTVSQTVSVDTVSPVLTHRIAGRVGNSPWYVSSITITASAADPTSAVEAIEYRINGGEWQAGQTITADDGIHTIDLRTKDNAGNQTEYSITVEIDSTPPTASITSPSDGATVAKTVMLSGAVSGGLSGVKSVQLKIDSSPWIEIDHWTETFWDHRWVTGYSMNGRHTIRLLVTDNAGNTAEDSITLHVENSLPIIFWATAIPTSTPLPSPTPTFIPTLIPTVTLPKPTAELSAPPSQWSGVQATATAAPTKQPQRKILGKGVVSSWKLYIIAAGLFGVFGLTFALDRRPGAYRKTAKILLDIMKNNSHQE